MRLRITALRVFIGAAVFLAGTCSAQNSGSAPGLRVIVVATSTKAQEILDQLKQGQDFAELAKAKSSDSTAANGGYMGRPDPGTLCTELRDALKDVGLGQITGIVQVPAGYAILTVLPASEVPPGNVNSTPLPWATAACAVHPAILVSGFGEAITILREFPKSEGWDRDLHQICAISRVAVPVTLD